MPASYYAIFDGHAGTDAAFYAASQLHEKLVQNPKFKSDPAKALEEAFLATDRSFVYEHEHEVGYIALVLFTTWLDVCNNIVSIAAIERRHDGRRDTHQGQFTGDGLVGGLAGRAG